MRIVVIGGGVAGLGIGWRLRQAGAEVRVLERAQAARGATWAAAGMIAVAGELGGANTPEAEFARHSRGLWAAFAAELEQHSGSKTFYRENGALMVSMPGEAARADGVGFERLDAAKARALEPMLTADMTDALWAPGEAQVDSRALGEALARAFVRDGGLLSLNEAVLRIENDGVRAVAALTPFGRYEADAFVLAAGAWSGLIEGVPHGVLPAVIPMKGEMIALSPAGGDALPRHVVWGNGVYLVPRGGRLLVGATVEQAGFDTSLTREAAIWLNDRAVTLMPALEAWEFADQWAGLRPGTPDGLPILGPTALEGLYAATGQFRNGILLAPAIAELLCRQVLERGPAVPAFDPRRFS